MEICKQQSEIEKRHIPAISIYGYVGGRLLHFSLIFFLAWKVWATGLVGLWALEWAWHIRVTNLRCVRNLNLEFQFSVFDSFRYIRVHIYDFLKFVGGLWAAFYSKSNGYNYKLI